MRWLERLREKTLDPSPQAVTKVTEGAFGAFVTASPGGHQFFARPVTPPPADEVADKYPPDEVGGAPCPVCGAGEWWLWLDGRRLCRPCLIAARTPKTVSEEG
jgi:hypothetical protein